MIKEVVRPDFFEIRYYGLFLTALLNPRLKRLKSTSSPDRTFNLKVTELTSPSKIVWQDGFAPMFKGIRTYTLRPKGDGTTDFSMIEVISGLVLPMIGGSLPDFRPTFEQYAADLKREAEKVSEWEKQNG